MEKNTGKMEKKMKKLMVIAGQNDQNYGQRLIYRKMHTILKEKGIEFIFPRLSLETLGLLPFYEGVIFAGKIKGFLEDLAIIDFAIELRKPVFLLGINLENAGACNLEHLSTILMSPLVSGFTTDEVSRRWASLWAGLRIKKGVDLATIYLLERSKHERSKFAVFAPSKNGILKSCTDEEWFPKIDARVIVEDPSDSKTAASFAQKIKADDVTLIFQSEDIIDAVCNAKFILSEKHYVTMTGATFEVPFAHTGKTAKRYFEKYFSEDFFPSDDTGLALAISKFNDMKMDDFKLFGSELSQRYKSMIDSLDEFLKSL
jgi:hypothetical protein